jgi:hypothetical protein
MMMMVNKALHWMCCKMLTLRPASHTTFSHTLYYDKKTFFLQYFFSLWELKIFWARTCLFWSATGIFWQKISFYQFIAISFYRNVAILRAKMSCLTRALEGWMTYLLLIFISFQSFYSTKHLLSHSCHICLTLFKKFNWEAII